MSKKTETAANCEFGLYDAMLEAERCLMCHDAPCSTGCPANTDPGKFIRQLRLKNIKGAARTVRKNNILGGICAEVCPTCKLCVEKCSRTGIDSPVKINQIQRFLANYQNEMDVEVFDKPKPLGKKIAVIGSGPAGLSCAANLALAGYEVDVFEKDAVPGGVMAWGIPYYRLSRKTLENDIAAVKKLGVKIKCSSKIEGEKAIEKLLKKGYSAVYLATGLDKSNMAKIEGSDYKNVCTAKEFLTSVNDEKNRKKAASLVKGKNVAVIGGGSVAMDAATSAKKLGAERVYAISLEALNELPADIEEIELSRKHDIIFKPSTQVLKITGKGGKVEAIEGCDIEWKVAGKFTPDNAKQIKGTSFTHRVDAVIFAIGSRLDGDTVVMLKSSGAAITPRNLIKINDKYSTGIKNVYAGGDMASGGKTVAAAVYDGKMAAKAIHEAFSTKGRR